jgi:hypothetical protein
MKLEYLIQETQKSVNILSLNHGAKVLQTLFKLWKTKFCNRKWAKTNYNKGRSLRITVEKHFQKWEILSIT